MIEALLSKKKAEKLYVDDVFSTYIYTGNGGTQTMNNGIDLAEHGGLVWLKGRDVAYSHQLTDTFRGSYRLFTDQTVAQDAATVNTVTTYLEDGFVVQGSGGANSSGTKYVSWTFRRAPKFFDVVTYTGNGIAGRQIAHGLGIAPGMIVVKRTDSTNNWTVYFGDNERVLYLNSTDPQSGQSATYWNNTSPTDSHFTVGSSSTGNLNGAQYVAYLFAHDDSEDGIIQCGSYTGNGSMTGPSINLGWEPQYLLVKNASGTGDWILCDAMRGMPVGSANALLSANTSGAEVTSGRFDPSATGFSLTTTDTWFNASGNTYIYLAIRRPNKPPTSGTEVYNAIARTGTGAAATVSGVGFAPDLAISKDRIAVRDPSFYSKLTGVNNRTSSATTSAEVTETFHWTSFSNDGGVIGGAGSECNLLGDTFINYFFRRAPGFFDVVCYTGTGVARTVPHGLGVAPELMVVKRRDLAEDWYVFSSAVGVGKWLRLNTTAVPSTASNRFDTLPTADEIYIGSTVASAGRAYIAYLFASLPGISKVGTYTGNGASQTIPCGFTTGARFILIKRTDAAGDWYVWDSARGIVAANDPHLSLNTAAAEVTTDDSVDPHASGFIVNQNAATNINVSGGQYIFLAIA